MVRGRLGLVRAGVPSGADPLSTPPDGKKRQTLWSDVSLKQPGGNKQVLPDTYRQKCYNGFAKHAVKIIRRFDMLCLTSDHRSCASCNSFDKHVPRMRSWRAHYLVILPVVRPLCTSKYYNRSIVASWLFGQRAYTLYCALLRTTSCMYCVYIRTLSTWIHHHSAPSGPWALRSRSEWVC